MEKFKVLKNHCQLDHVNEYIIIDEKSKTQSRVKATPTGLKELLNYSSFVGISPIQYMRYSNYRTVSLAEIVPLPF